MPPGRARRTFRVEGGDLVGDVEVLVDRQAEERLGGAYLLDTERLPVRLLGVGAVRRRPADVAAQNEQGRAVGLRHSPAQPGFERVQVVRHLAEALHVPPVALRSAP